MMKSTLAFLALVASPMFATPLDPIVIGRPDGVTGPNPKEVTIESLKYGGTGCPQGTIGQSISDDRSTYTLIFDSYIASVGPGVSITEGRKNCQVNLALRIPQGWQFSILSTDFRGFAALDAGVTGTQKSTYYFAGESKQVSVQKDFVGPYSQDYLSHHEIGVQTAVWCPCGSTANLNINGQVRLMSSNSQATGQLANDSQDGKFEQKLGLSWRKC